MLRRKVRRSALAHTRARDLRERQTRMERILWGKLRARRFHGIKFRRQVPLGPFIADFLCVEARLIVEVDGSSHYREGAQEYDAMRDAYLKEHGFKIVRVSNSSVRTSLDFVLETIKDALL